MSSEPSAVPSTATRPRFWWVKWVLAAVVAVILVAEVYYIWPRLKDAWARIGDLNWWWIAACIVAAMLSMDSFAQVQRALLRSAGVVVSQWKSLSVVLAANSLSATMPGGQVLAPAFTYRETRKWGATPVVASWQVVMSGLLAGVGLAVLGFGGAILAGAKTSPFSVMFSVLGFIAVLVMLQYLAAHPESLQAMGEKILGWINQVRNKPADHGVARLASIIDQLRAVQLTRRDGGIAFGWSLFNWVADVGCLAFACYAVGGEPSISGLMVAYAASKAVGTAVPLLPGGIGVVDAVLAPALASAGMPFADAILAVLVYRLISFVLVAAVGWVVILAMFRTTFRDEKTIEDEYEREMSDITQTDTAQTDTPGWNPAPPSPDIPPDPPATRPPGSLDDDDPLP